jgi:hypothetical protein
MKHVGLLIILAVCVSLPSGLMAQSSYENNHVEVGAFAEYLRFSAPNPAINYAGVGGRVGFNVHPNVALEAEMSYDFERNYTNTFSNGATTRFVQTSLRPITGLFGPKFQAGTSGPFRAFVTGKVGFINFNTSNSGPISGFVRTVGYIPDGNTHFALYPGGGVEAFAGPLGIRLEAGDEIYFDNGTRNNLKVSVGPVLRF